MYETSHRQKKHLHSICAVAGHFRSKSHEINPSRNVLFWRNCVAYMAAERFIVTFITRDNETVPEMSSQPDAKFSYSRKASRISRGGRGAVVRSFVRCVPLVVRLIHDWMALIYDDIWAHAHSSKSEQAPNINDIQVDGISRWQFKNKPAQKQA